MGVLIRVMSSGQPTGGSMRQRSSPKRRGSPGPGAYDPRPVSSLGQSHRKGQTSSFKSSSERPLGLNGPKTADKTGDPGQYDPHSSFTGSGKKSFGYEEKPSPSALDKLKGKAKKGGKLGTFGGGSTKRELRMDLMGEATPGPGSYLPASTFGKHATSKEAQQQRTRPTSSFKSTSLQRARPPNEHVPGAGAYSPNHGSIEKNSTNPGNSLIAKSQRFGKGGMDLVISSTDDDIGPGAYESHVHGSVAKKIAKNVEMMSRQNPGFGIAGPAHELPHEQTVEDDQDLPGPGKYESASSEVTKANGHASSFKLPVKRSKVPPDDTWNGSPKGGDGAGGGSRRGSGKKGSGSSKADASKATIHV